MKLFTIYGYPERFKVTQGITLNFESSLGRFLKVGKQSIFVDYVNPPVLSNDKKYVYFSEINTTKTTKKMLFSFPEEAFKSNKSKALVLWKLKMNPEEKKLKLIPEGESEIWNISMFNIGGIFYMGALTSIPDGDMIVSTPILNGAGINIPPSIIKYEKGFIRIKKIIEEE